MYKYLIYCSVSAVIIIAAKYVYQNWIKQNHTIATIKQDIQLLQNKVKNVEEHFEKTKASMSGGVTIPIVFQKLNQSQPVQQPPKPQSPVQIKNTVHLNNDLSSESSVTISSVSNTSDTKSTSRSSKNVQTIPNVITLSPKKLTPLEKELTSVSSETKSSKSSSKKKVLDLSEEKEKVKDILDTTIEVSNKLHIEEALDNEILPTETPKKVTKKKSLPDPKDYNNGDKYKDDAGVDYLCVVGKRGGHSWQKINANI